MQALLELLQALPVIAGLTAITVLSRSLFMLPEREWRLPEWLKRGLRYAPLAALAAVLGPELLMRDGRLLHTWADARLPATAAALACYAWRRSILPMLLAGMAVYLPLHIGLGW